MMGAVGDLLVGDFDGSSVHQESPEGEAGDRVEGRAEKPPNRDGRMNDNGEGTSLHNGLLARPRPKARRNGVSVQGEGAGQSAHAACLETGDGEVKRRGTAFASAGKPGQQGARG